VPKLSKATRATIVMRHIMQEAAIASPCECDLHVLVNRNTPQETLMTPPPSPCECDLHVLVNRNTPQETLMTPTPSPCECDLHVLGPAGISCNEGQVDLSGGGAAQLTLGLLSGLTQALHGKLVGR
jgi:hypothetical protein